MRKTLALTATLLIALSMTACGNASTSQPASSSVPSSTTPKSSVAEKKDDYVYIGGKTPYEVLTATEEANIKKAEEEARLQAEAKAKADAEAKAQAEAKRQAEQQAQANQTAEVQNTEQTGGVQQAQPAQQAEQPAPAGKRWYTFPNGERVLIFNSAYEAHMDGIANAPDEKSRRQAEAFVQRDLEEMNANNN